MFRPYRRRSFPLTFLRLETASALPKRVRSGWAVIRPKSSGKTTSRIIGSDKPKQGRTEERPVTGSCFFVWRRGFHYELLDESNDSDRNQHICKSNGQ